MATEPQQVLMVEGTLAQETVLVTHNREDEESEVGADILQQALQEATETFDPQADEKYEDVENAVAVVHGAPDEDEEEEEEEDLDETFEESDSNSNVNYNTQTSTTNTVSTTTNAVRVFGSVSQSTPASNNTNNNTTENQSQLSAPIGSSLNPIQIIQQGNTYTSTQLLSQEQLQQIAQVLQQQQQMSQLSPNGSTSVLYNAATNTRIVYRIVYPSDLQSKVKSTSTPTTVKLGAGRGRGRPRKPWGKRFEIAEEKAETPDMSREEKEEKKKHRPRTRSGRISKPPKHMMKDYKRIHHLDFDEEPYDDSDGGYSDYHISGEDDNSRSSTSSILPAGVSTSKPRKYQCRTCSKAYIGRGGLSRHFKLNPDHGNIDEIEPEAIASSASMDGLLSEPATPASIGGSQASNDGVPVSGSTGLTSSTLKRGRGRPSNQKIGAARRKAKLKDLIKQYDNEELMETVLPRLTDVVSVWEFLLMKCEKGSSSRPDVSEICKQLELVIKQAQKVAQDQLTLQTDETNNENENSHLEITNTYLAATLGIATGCYEVKKPTKTETSAFQYKMLTSDPAEIRRIQPQRRTIEMVTPEEIIVQIPNKRQRLMSDSENKAISQSSEVDERMITSLPPQILQEGQDDALDFEQFNDGLDQQENIETEDAITDVVDESLGTEEGTQNGQLIAVLSNNESIIQEKSNEICLTENADQRSSEMEETSFLTMEEEKPQTVSEMKILNSNPVENGNEETNRQDENCQLVNEDQIDCTDTGATHIIVDDDSKVIHVTENDGSQFVTSDGHMITTLQDETGQTILGQMLCQSGNGGEVVRQVMIQEGQVISSAQLQSLSDVSEFSGGLLPSNVVIVNADGTTTTLQLPSDQNIPLETVQALLAMDSETRSHILNQQSEQTTEEEQ